MTITYVDCAAVKAGYLCQGHFDPFDGSEFYHDEHREED